jgi:hypothetical protein
MQQSTLWNWMQQQENPTPADTVIDEGMLNIFSRKQRQYLFGPVIKFRPGGWEYPARLLDLVRPARYRLLLSGEDELATELEALGYISTASLEAPLSREWAQIMFWLSDRVLHRWNLVPDTQSIWEMLGYEKPIQLDPYLETEPRRLRLWLRKAIVKHAAAQK